MSATAPEPGDPAYRCAAASLLRDDVVGGSASTYRAFFLVEHPGPWGVDALRDARFPDGVAAQLQERGRGTGVRVLLVRRPVRSDRRHRPRVFAVHADAAAPWVESAEVADLHEVCDIDLSGLSEGRSVGLPRHDGSLFCVCTHGRHDACCAERGRPVATALAAAHPEETWEVSHIGGDRFAANMAVFPHGLYYGRLDPRSALAVAGGHLAGQVDLDHLRGRSGFPMPVQAAEIGLRRELGETRTDALRLVRRTSREADTEAVFEVAGATYAVQVRTAKGPEQGRLTCRARRDNPLPRHDVVSVARVDG